MKSFKRFAVILVLLLVGVYASSHYLYESKYDDYVAECIRLEARNGTLKLKLDITADQTEYHHLGRDITREYLCNGLEVKDGDIIPYKERLNFVATVTEHDSVDDVGTAEMQLKLPPYNGKKSVVVRVDEKGGRKYSDAYAVWKITFEVKPYTEGLEIGYWDVVFS